MRNPILTARIVRCKFDNHGSGLYSYYTDDKTIKEGDLVVVVVPQNRNGDAFTVSGAQLPAKEGEAPQPPAAPMGYAKIVRVMSTEETVEGVEKVREWIVCKLDFEEYSDRRAIEEKRKVLNAKIKRAVAEAKEALEMDDLVSRSPELKALLEQAEKL